MGLLMFLKDGKVAGLFAVAATPMTLAFFGIPTLAGGFFVIVPTYYALSFFGLRRLVPFVVFAVGAAIALYLIIVQPAPTGAMPGYDQTAQGFAAAALILWAFYAYFRTNIRHS